MGTRKPKGKEGPGISPPAGPTVGGQAEILSDLRRKSPSSLLLSQGRPSGALHPQGLRGFAIPRAAFKRRSSKVQVVGVSKDKLGEP